ncbi:MAG: GGDEF domain-containing protein, partial [Bauldia sp.]
MKIDLPTLMIAGSFVAAVSGVFLVFAWLQNRKATATLWWAASNLVLAVSIPMMAASNMTVGSPAVVVAITLLNLSPALIWASARSCNARRVNPAIVGGGALAWLVAYAVPTFRGSGGTQLSLNLAIVAAFLLAAAYEFWRDRHERLTARWPLIVLLGLHGSLSAIGAVQAAVGGLATTTPAAMVIWLEFVHFETLAFVIGTSIFTVAMARERSELIHKIAASTDALTGVATRRAFYDTAEDILTAGQEHDSGLAVVVFDLDGFKSINDTFGHGHGDDVLKVFGNAAKRTLRSTDLIGRLGGEEFAAVLPGASVAAAFVAAERIRANFSEACRNIDGLAVNATVSAGVAQAHPRSTLDSLLQAADAALY